MPSRYVLRHFIEGGYYHVFNRGVEKRDIFLDTQDYRMFHYYLSVYLLPCDVVLLRYPKVPIRLIRKNIHADLKLLSFCLMPNHFHLLVRQQSVNGVTQLLKQVTNAYTLYFNEKYERIGGLVQGRFRAIQIEDEDLLLHLIRYIHLNPIVANIVQDPREYRWSSHREYLGERSGMCTTDLVLSHFTSLDGYRQFVNDQVEYARELHLLKQHAALED